MMSGLWKTFTVLVALAAIGCTGATAGGEIPTPMPTPLPEAVHDIDIRAMLDLLFSSEVAAEAKYKGKLVRTTGIIDRIERDHFRLLPLDSGDFQGAGLECHLIREQHPIILNLRKGEEVTIFGRHDGFAGVSVNTAAIQDCQILPDNSAGSVITPPTTPFLVEATSKPELVREDSSITQPNSTSTAPPAPALTPPQIFGMLDRGKITEEEAKAMLRQLETGEPTASASAGQRSIR